MRKLIASAARHPVFPNLLMVIILLSGVYGYLGLRRESMPEIKADIIDVTIAYPGASATEVEEGIVVKVENALNGVVGIKNVTAFAREGMGRIMVELKETARNKQKIITDLKERIDQISTFPKGAQPPQVRQIVNSDVAFMLVLSGNISERVMREMAYDIREDLMNRGIFKIDLGGVRDYEIVIEISRASMDTYGLTLSEVAKAVKQGSVNLPSGSVKTQDREYKIEVKGRRYTAESYGNLVVKAVPDGNPIRVRDVAQVRDGFEEGESIGRFDGKRAVLFNIMRTGDEDTIEIADVVHDYLNKKIPTLPIGVQLSILGDFSDEVVKRIDILVTNAWQGLILLMISLWFFTNLRLALWITVGIPIAFAFTGIIMSFKGLTLNSVSLFGLILVLGIVVDDAIVIGENIYRYQQQGMPSLEAAIKGTAEMAWPVIAAVSTTVLAFLPLFFVSGVMGKFIAVMPVVVVATLVGSLVEGMLILPAHLGHGHSEKKGNPGFGQQVRNRIEQGIDFVINRIYRPVYHLSLDYRYTTVSLSILCACVSLGLLSGGQVPFVLFPEADTLFLQAEVEFPDGTPLDVTRKAIEEIENGAFAINRKYGQYGDKEKRLTQGVYSEAGGATGGSHKGRVRLTLVPPENRTIHSKDILNYWRKETPGIPNAVKLSFSAMGGIGASVKDIELLLSGPRLETIEKVAFDIQEVFRKLNGVYDVGSDFKMGKPVLNINLKPQGEALGITLEDLANQLKQGFYGVDVLKVQRGRDEVDVQVRYPYSDRKSLSDLYDVRIKTPSGDRTPFGEVADVTLRRGISEIKRQDGKRRLSVFAAVDKNLTTPVEVISEFRNKFMPEFQQRFPDVSVTFGGSNAESQDSLMSLATGFLFAALGIYTILALVFRSYLQPLIIMTTIPLGLIGAVAGHYIMGYALSMLSLFGVVALAGVVVNDSLVLIERINDGQREGLSILNSLREAGPRRFKAIIITSVTTVAGLLPLLSEKSLQAQDLKPMALSLAAGLIFATVLTLFVVPSFYYILNDIKCFIRWMKKGYWPEREKVEPAYIPQE